MITTTLDTAAWWRALGEGGFWEDGHGKHGASPGKRACEPAARSSDNVWHTRGARLPPCCDASARITRAAAARGAHHLASNCTTARWEEGRKKERGSQEGDGVRQDTSRPLPRPTRGRRTPLLPLLEHDSAAAFLASDGFCVASQAHRIPVSQSTIEPGSCSEASPAHLLDGCHSVGRSLHAQKREEPVRQIIACGASSCPG